MPTTKTTAPKRNTHAAPETLRIAAAIGAATVPPRIAISASREFARTSSSGSSTTAGTSALLATECPFESTSIANASGYSSSSSIAPAISRQRIARPADGGGDEQPPPAARPVEQGAEHRRDDRERRHREHEVQDDLATRRRRRRAEEDRVGEGDRHEDVAAHADRVRERQP